MSIYLIDNSFYFDEESESIWLKDNERGKVFLGRSSSVFLSLLLKNHGKVIKKDEIISTIWGGEGLVVSDNSYYQLILILRRKIQDTGFKEEIISTVPRKGLMISFSFNVVITNNTDLSSGKSISDVSLIKTIEDNYGEDCLTHLEGEKNGLMISPSIDTETTSNIASSNEETATIKNKTLNDTYDQDKLHITQTKYKKRNYKSLFIKLSFFISFYLLIVACSLFYHYTEVNIPDWDWSPYNTYYEDGDCIIKKNGDFPSETIDSEFHEIIINTCIDNNYIYVTSYDFTLRLSIIACKKDMSEKNNRCKSIYYIFKRK